MKVSRLSNGVKVILRLAKYASASKPPKIPKQLSKYKYSVLKTVKYCNTKYGHFMIIASKAHINV